MKLIESTGLNKKADEILLKVKEKLPEMAPMFKQCFLSTMETTVQQLEDSSYFVITGDIPAMWLRDSAAQLRPYIKYAVGNEPLQEIFRSVIGKHAYYVNLDPYSNAFNSHEIENPQEEYHDTTNFQNGLIWERKYEVDSLCASLYLAYEYFDVTGDRSILNKELEQMIKVILETFKLEQNHEDSKYFFIRDLPIKTETLVNGGRGRPVNRTGMTWSGFRPSDDACTFNYLIPANMMAVVALRYGSELAVEMENKELADSCKLLSDEIEDGIETYGVYNHPKYGKIYAYETDGYGNYNLMDDANSPSLLSIPYLGYRNREDEIYQNTRRFILSRDNPYYYEGSIASGIGSPHTPENYIWHISLVMQVLTSGNEIEVINCLDMIAKTHAGTNFMHEGFDVNSPENYTRPWFAWANTLFAEMVEGLVDGEL